MLLLICGWPACGKAYFANWLEEHRGFRHLNLGDFGHENDALRVSWEKDVPASAPAFVAALTKRHPNWVLTWGAPADCVPRLEALRAAGFEAWFLIPGSDERSRLEWLKRERASDPEVRPKEWERRANEIRKNARDLRRFFRDRCIESVSRHGEYLPCEEMATRMNVPRAAA